MHAYGAPYTKKTGKDFNKQLAILATCVIFKIKTY